MWLAAAASKPRGASREVKDAVDLAAPVPQRSSQEGLKSDRNLNVSSWKPSPDSGSRQTKEGGVHACVDTVFPCEHTCESSSVTCVCVRV